LYKAAFTLLLFITAGPNTKLFAWGEDFGRERAFVGFWEVVVYYSRTYFKAVRVEGTPGPGLVVYCCRTWYYKVVRVYQSVGLPALLFDVYFCRTYSVQVVASVYYSGILNTVDIVW
jgi:hypothetical protein